MSYVDPLSDSYYSDMGPVTVGRGGESCTSKRLLQRPLSPVSEALRVFVVRPKVGSPGTFFEPVPEFRYQSWDARAFGSFIAGGSENPDVASGSP